MKSRPLPFSRIYRRFRYWSKQLNRQIADGTYAHLSPKKQARLQAKIRRLYHRLSRVVSQKHLKQVLAGAALVIGLSGSVQAQNFAAPLTNPFGLTGNNSFNVHTLVDIDGDGDLDVMATTYNTNTYANEVTFVENTGSATAPAFAAPVVDPFGLTSVAPFTDFEFADMDGDGDLDAFGGAYGGQVAYYENTGTSTAPAFAAAVNNPFGIPNNNNIYAFPTVGDLDGDGDFDLMISEYYGEFFYYENTGTNMAPAFATGVANPFGLPAPAGSPYMYHHELVDMDGDGDLDIMAGTYNYYGSEIYYFENTGTVNAPAFAAVQVSPFNIVLPQGELALLAVGDLDDDSDFDLLVTGYYGVYSYYENVDTVTNPVNTPPVLDTLNSQTICSGDTLMLPFMASDADGDSLTFLTSSDDQALLADANISISGTAPNYQLDAIPTPGVLGTVNVTVSALDGTDTTTSIFPLLVENCNTAPAIGTLSNFSICRDSAWNDFSFQVLDADGDSLTVTATSDNQTLLPDVNISVAGAIPTYTFSGTPAAGETGIATVTVIAADAFAADTATFTLEVVACNSEPVIGDIGAQTACSFFVYGPIDFMVTDADNDALTVTASSSNQTVIPDANITISGTAPDYTFTLQPIAGQIGTLDITIMASDDSSSVSSVFPVTVDGCTGIEEPAFARDMRLFPNPTQGLLTLTSATAVAVEAIQVMDLQGRELVRQQFDGLQDRWELDLNSLPAGTYLLRIRTAEAVLNRRISKQ
ncbi:MAG: FG-GAP-like repeat-containing protein [Bacteroidota bacterium]